MRGLPIRLFRGFFPLMMLAILPQFGWASYNIDSLLATLDTMPENQQRVRTYLDLARGYELIDLEASFDWLDKMEALAMELEDMDGLRRVHKERGILQKLHGSPDSALYWFQLIAEHPEWLLTTRDSADTENLLGMGFLDLGQLDTAIYHLNRAAAGYRKIEYLEGEITIFTNIGIIFYETGDLEQALHFLKKAYQLSLKAENLFAHFPVISNYASLLVSTGSDTDSVQAMFLELEAHPDLENDPNMARTLHQNIASLYTRQGDWALAEQHYFKALKIAEQGQVPELPQIYTGLAMNYYGQGKYTNSIQYERKAQQLASLPSEFKWTYQSLAKSFTQLGQKDSALHYWDRLLQLRDSMESERHKELMAEAQENLTVVEKEYEIKELQQQRALDQLSKRVSYLAIVVLVLMLALGGYMAWTVIRRKKEETLLQQAKLKQKNEHLVNLSLSIHQKNQVLRSFEDKLKAQREKGGDSQLLTDLSKSLTQFLKIDEDWERFEAYFHDLNHGFYDILKERWPNLTNQELRICTLAKLRFNIKEMAQTLFISVDSVKSSRYRIRKKLAIETEQDLSDFLNELV
ncbi:tetratricopeptide repeat protein [Pontibacter sp. G13]|uniref:tetratricopeptide repeat protein n=1 Tax=Pontibacter sp. G13 TaxID=3074898 RepID=UPI00288A3A42|nr:tetratricopeptide repeat protein [Pontibacter sp. G13]WNJ17696.1 tetratricopeptide repeat protein [Pontibacter sp. G13]